MISNPINNSMSSLSSNGGRKGHYIFNMMDVFFLFKIMENLKDVTAILHNF